MALLTDLISYYKLDETSGTNADDAHGTNDGTANNARVFTTEVAGKINTGADFTETGDNINVPFTALNNQNQYSFSFWIKPNSAGGNNPRLLSQWNGLDNRHFIIRLTDKTTGKYQTFEAFFFGDSTAQDWTYDFVDDNWYHIVINADASANEAELFVNGVSQGTNTRTWSSKTSNVDFVIGGTDLTGVMDEIGIWTRVLTSSEVTELYNNGDGLAYSSFFGNVSGNVKIGTGNVEGATVRCIRQSDNTTVAQQTTNASGNYEFTGLSLGGKYHTAVEYTDTDGVHGTAGKKYNAKSLWAVEPKEPV